MKVLVIMSVILFIVGCDNAMAIKDYQDADKVTNDSWQDTNKAEAEVLPDTNDNTVQDTQADADIEINDNQPDNEQPDTAPGYEVQGNEVIDHVTGYIWQKGQSTEKLTYEQAVSYCDNLVINDITHWSIPTIDQLRTIVRGCPNTMTGGKCPISEACANSYTCRPSDYCDGCQEKKDKTAYLEQGIWDTTDIKISSIIYYSSTIETDGKITVWGLQISNAVLFAGNSKDNINAAAYVKCIKL